MMDLKTIIILALILLSYFQYSAPEKTNGLLNPVWGNVQGFIGNKLHFGGSSTSNTNTTGSCPDTDSPVCGNDGKTYTNTCYAMLAGVASVTGGACK